MSHKFPYDWSLNDYPSKNGLKVFSTFACGGGSTMGYKLAGFDVVAANDIDPQMERVYKANHNPKYFFQAPIKDLINMELPEELYAIDVLDGSQEPRKLFKEELLKIGTFPRDYDFLNIRPEYIIGMSVPPVMMAQVSSAIYEQWGKELLNGTRAADAIAA